MKALTLFTLCAALALYSCSSKPGVKPTPPNPVLADTITATIDGVPENFNTLDSAGYKNTSTYYSLSVSAKNGTSATADQLQLDVFNATPITPGTYSVYPGSFNPPYGPLIVYSTNGSSNFADDYVIDYTGAHVISINIATISSKEIKGTFSGTLIVAAGTSGATKTITDGKFNVYMK